MFSYTTQTLAILTDVQPASVRHSVCVNGHYLGIVPQKLPNGRLLFPADQVEVLFSKRPPEIGLQTITTLAHKVAYCESRGAEHKAVSAEYWKTLDAVIGAGQALGIVTLKADFAEICDLLEAEGNSHE